MSSKHFQAKLGDMVSAHYGDVKVTGILSGPGMIAHPGEGWFIFCGSIVPSFVDGARVERELYVRTYRLEGVCSVEMTWDDVTGTNMDAKCLTDTALQGAREYWEASKK